MNSLQCEAEVPTALYRCLGTAALPLYLGISDDPERRAREHAGKAPWWPRVDHSRTRIEWYANRAKAKKAEDHAILAEKPAFNSLGTPRFAERAKAASLKSRANLPSISVDEFLSRAMRASELPTSVDRFTEWSFLLDACPAVQQELREERRQTVLAMRAAGMSDVEIGVRVRKHWARISAIARGVTTGGSDKKRRQPAPPGHSPSINTTGQSE